MLSECFLFEINLKLFVKHFYQNAYEKKKFFTHKQIICGSLPHHYKHIWCVCAYIYIFLQCHLYPNCLTKSDLHHDLIRK